MRLQKFLASAGVASRRSSEELIEDGKIKVNGQIVTKLGTIIDETNDEIEFDGEIISIDSTKTYIAVNKPAGYISSASDKEGKSILKLVKTNKRLFPVGRLDKDSSGLLILTDDGDFANELTHPRYGSEKEYFVVLDNDLSQANIKKLERGIILEGRKLQSVKVSMVKNKSARLILHEGVNRQIRRMLGQLGYTVVKLKRIRIGKLELGDLKEGASRYIDKEDVV